MIFTILIGYIMEIKLINQLVYFNFYKCINVYPVSEKVRSPYRIYAAMRTRLQALSRPYAWASQPVTNHASPAVTLLRAACSARRSLESDRGTTQAPPEALMLSS